MSPSPVNSPSGVEVRAFTAGDESRVLDLLQATFGKWPSDIEGVSPVDFFRRKHEANPFGSSILTVAEADGAVIGFQAYLRWRLRAGGRTLPAMRGVDLAVHPSYRRRGVSLALIRTAAEHFSADAAFTFSTPNEQSRPGSLRSGRRQVGKLPIYVRPRRPLRGTIRWASGSRLKMPQHQEVEAKTAAEVLRDGANASQLLAQTKQSSDRLATAKDLTYLRWRYGQSEQYRAIRADAGGGIRGMAIFRLLRRGPVWMSRVCELFVVENDRRVTRHLLHQVGEAAGADLVSCSFPSHHDAALCGFIPSTRGAVLMAYPLHQNLVPDPTQRASWALSLGDLEVL
jgi:GNAT superfamily N-acetyltransferase